MPKQPDSIATQGMIDEVTNADEVIIIAVNNGQMKVMTSSPDAQACVALLAVAHNTMVGTLADAMFSTPTQLDG